MRTEICETTGQLYELYVEHIIRKGPPWLDRISHKLPMVGLLSSENTAVGKTALSTFSVLCRCTFKDRYLGNYYGRRVAYFYRAFLTTALETLFLRAIMSSHRRWFSHDRYIASSDREYPTY